MRHAKTPTDQISAFSVEDFPMTCGAAYSRVPDDDVIGSPARKIVARPKSMILGGNRRRTLYENTHFGNIRVCMCIDNCGVDPINLFKPIYFVLNKTEQHFPFLFKHPPTLSSWHRGSTQITFWGLISRCATCL